MKIIRILNTLFFAVFLVIVYQIYQAYHERNEKIEKENQLVKLELDSSFPVRKADFYLTQKDSPVQKKVEIQASKEEDIALPSVGTVAPKLPEEKHDVTKSEVKTEVKPESKELKKIEKVEKTEKKVMAEKKVNKVEISKAIVIEKKESPVEKPVEQQKKSTPVVTEIKEVKLPKVAPGGIQEIEGTFDPN